MVKRQFIYFVAIGLMMWIFAGCSQNNESLPLIEENNASEPKTVEIAFEPMQTNEPEIEPYTTEATLLAVGDIMMHDWQIDAGYNPNTKSYNYDHFFSAIKDVLAQGDWVIGNLETTISGADLRFTGYPMFNAPSEILDALQGAGFNVLTHANNHTLDRKETGVIRTREALEERGIATHGTARSIEENNEILIIEKNEIKLAIIAYTYGTNGIPIPDGKEYLVNLIDEDRIMNDITRARELGADVVAVSLHFGVEYQLKPNKEQINLAHNLVRAGADIILGSHPHVVQPYEVIEIEDGDGSRYKGVVIYSMGNFISAQVGEERNLGLIFGLTLRKHFPEGTVEIAEISNTPTWVQRYKGDGKTQFRVVPLAKSLEEQNDDLLGANDYKNMERYLDRINKHVESMATLGDSKGSQ